jgi:hypothetical protein
MNATAIDSWRDYYRGSTPPRDWAELRRWISAGARQLLMEIAVYGFARMPHWSFGATSAS